MHKMKDWQVIIGEKDRQKFNHEKIKLYFLIIKAATTAFLIGYVFGAGRII